MFDFLIEFFDEFVVLGLDLSDLLCEVFFLFFEGDILIGNELIVLLEFESLVLSGENFGSEFGEELVLFFLLFLSELGGFFEQQVLVFVVYFL